MLLLLLLLLLLRWIRHNSISRIQANAHALIEGKEFHRSEVAHKANAPMMISSKTLHDFFDDHLLTSSWTSHSSVFGVNLAPCWLPAWLHVGSMLASSWPHVGSSWLENRPKCVPNRFILALGEGLGGILGASGGAWGPSRLQDGFKTPKVKVLTLSWRPSWRPKSIKNRI